MRLIDNVNNTVRDDLEVQIKKDSKVSVAAACFSIYAFKELKKQLEKIDEFRFIFTSPTFLKEEDSSKVSKEFYISRLNRERDLYGTEFEIKLRNKLTQRAIAKECADWIRRKASFKTNVTQEYMQGFMSVNESTYMPMNGFTTVDLGCEKGNNVYYPVQETEEAYDIIEVYEKNFGKCINKVVEPAGLPIPTYEEPKKSIWQQIIDLIAGF